MNILIIGGGGREHALAWKLVHDRRKPEVFCAPGNGGTAALAANLDIAAEDIEGLAAWAREARPDLTVVGPEVPLCAGLADRFNLQVGVVRVLAVISLLVFFWMTAAIYIAATLLIREKPLIFSGTRSEYEFWRRECRRHWREE